LFDYAREVFAITPLVGVYCLLFWVLVVAPISTVLYYKRTNKYFKQLKEAEDTIDAKLIGTIVDSMPYTRNRRDVEHDRWGQLYVIFDPWVSVYYSDNRPTYFGIILKTTPLMHYARCLFLGGFFTSIILNAIMLAGVYFYNQYKQKQDNYNRAIEALRS